MRKKDLIFPAVLSAAIMSFAGIGLAASPYAGQLAQAQTEQPPTGGAEQPAAQAEPKEGMEVVNAEGQKIGEVKSVEGEQIIVSIGEYLGIGARDVALSRDQLQPTGSGEDAKLQTSMTQQELQQLPPHEGGAGGGSAPGAAPGGEAPSPGGGGGEAPSPGGGGGGEGGGG